MSRRIVPEAFFLKPDNPPFKDSFKLSMDAYFAATNFLLRTKPEKWSAPETTQYVNKFFWDFLNQTSNHYDPHLSEAPYPERVGLSAMRTFADEGENRSNRQDPIPPHGETRASLLLKSELSGALSFQRDARTRAKAQKRERNAALSEYLPSPLAFLRKLFTAPDFPASDGYAHARIRAEIFSAAIEFHDADLNAAKDTKDLNAFELVRSFLKFDAIVLALQTLDRHWKKRDFVAPGNPTAFVVFHLLASRGYLLLRFSESGEVSSSKNKQLSARDFLESKSLWTRGTRYAFRVSPSVRRLPSASEIINELDGIPVPVTGASTVFMRGIRFTQDQGVVGRASGAPGSGKT